MKLVHQREMAPFVRGTKLLVVDTPSANAVGGCLSKRPQVGDWLWVASRKKNGWMRVKNGRTQLVVSLRNGPWVKTASRELGEPMWGADWNRARQVKPITTIVQPGWAMMLCDDDGEPSQADTLPPPPPSPFCRLEYPTKNEIMEEDEECEVGGAYWKKDLTPRVAEVLDSKTSTIQEQAAKIQEMEQTIATQAEEVKAAAAREDYLLNELDQQNQKVIEMAALVSNQAGIIAELEERIVRLKAVIKHDTMRLHEFSDARAACERQLDAVRGPGPMQPNFTYRALSDYEVAKAVEATARELISKLPNLEPPEQGSPEQTPEQQLAEVMDRRRDRKREERMAEMRRLNSLPAPPVQKAEQLMRLAVRSGKAHCQCELVLKANDWDEEAAFAALVALESAHLSGETLAE